MATRDALFVLLLISVLCFSIGMLMENSINFERVSLTGLTIAENETNETEYLNLTNESVNLTLPENITLPPEENITMETNVTEPENVTLEQNITQEIILNETIADTSEEVKVIVVYDTPMELDVALELAEDEAKKEVVDEIASALNIDEAQIEPRLEENPIEINYEFESSTAVAATVTEEQLEALEENPDVEVYEDKPFQISLSQSVPFINATQLWPIQINGVNVTGQGQTVCIVDTGINDSHPAFSGRVIAQADFCADNTNCITNDTIAEDMNGHGTHCAGIVASSDSTYKGVAPGASLAIAKAANSGGTLYISTITAGIEWCAANAATYNITVISLSFGDGGEYGSGNCPISSYPTIEAALNSAANAGIFIVAASGNSGHDAGINYPACNSKTVSVGSVDRAADIVQPYSNSGNNLDLLAPGGSSLSQIMSASKDGLNFVNKYGTSMATPHVAGLAALVLQYNKLKNGFAMNQTALEAKLKATGINVNDSKNNITTPRVNATAVIMPIITLESPANRSYSAGDINFNITVDSNITYAFAEFNGTIYNLINDSSAHWYNLTMPILPLGNYNATFTAVSDVNSTKTVFFSVEVIPPQIILESPANGSVINRGDILNFTITDDTGVDIVVVEYNDGTNSTNFTNSTLASPYDYNTSSWFKGAKSIVVYANDTAGNSNSSYFEFNVSNSAPIFKNVQQPASNYTVFVTKPLSIVANATDPDNDTVNYSISTNVTSNYTLQVASLATWSWTPGSSEAGEYYLQFNATDNEKYSIAKSTVTVRANNAPSLSTIADQTATAGTQKQINFTASDADLNYGDSLAWSDNTSIFGITVINATNAKAVFTPSNSQIGTHYVKVTVSDIVGASAYKTFKLVISNSTGGSSGSKTEYDDYAGLGGLYEEVIYDNEKVFDYIPQDVPVTFAPKLDDLTIDNIVLETRSDAMDVVLKIRTLSSVDFANSDAVLDYFELVASGLSNSDIRSVTLQFSVPRSWLEQNGLDAEDVYLGVLSGVRWTELPTSIVSDDGLKVSYEATTTHLSTFAIAGKPQVVAPAPTTFETTAAANRTSNKASFELPTEYFSQNKSSLVTLGLVLLFCFVVLMMKRRPELFFPKHRRTAGNGNRKSRKETPDFGF